MNGESVSIEGLHTTRWAGSAKTFVLLHAGIADRRSWYEAAQNLTGFGSVVAYDRRGFGETPPSKEAFSHIGDLLAVLDAVADEPAWLIGSSKGGGLALDLALLHPERVAGLILIAPGISGSPDDDEGIDPDTARLIAQLREAGARGDLDAANQLETRLWLDGPAGPAGRVNGAARDLALAMNGIVLANDVPGDAGASGIDAWARLGEVAVPTAMAWGSLDIPLLIDECRKAAGRIPGCSETVIEGAAHLPYLEKPPSLAELVGQTL